MHELAMECPIGIFVLEARGRYLVVIHARHQMSFIVPALVGGNRGDDASTLVPKYDSCSGDHPVDVARPVQREDPPMDSAFA